MASERTTRRVPRSALGFEAELRTDKPAPSTSDGPRMLPFSMVARTGGLAEHPFWGSCIHDFAGMETPHPRISVDYCHDSQQVLGFAEDIKLAGEALHLSGSLVSRNPDDRAAEVFDKAHAGVPYQCSIFMNQSGLEIEWIPEGFDVEVNGVSVAGPVTIFRKWQLWGVAVCPYGSDTHTSLQFSAGAASDVDVIELKDSSMSKETAPPAKTGKDYLQAFGAKGGVWFAEGKSWDEARGLFEADQAEEAKAKEEKFAAIEKENGELKAKLSAMEDEKKSELSAATAETDKVKGEYAALNAKFTALQRGGDPLSTTPADKDGKPAPPASAVSGLDRFAASLKLPGAK